MTFIDIIEQEKAHGTLKEISKSLKKSGAMGSIL